MTKAEEVFNLFKSVNESYPRITKKEMLDSGFLMDKTTTDKGATLDWYTHPSILGRHFLIRDDRTGVMYGDKDGITDTLSGPKEILHVLKNFIKK